MQSGSIINCFLIVCATVNFCYAFDFFRKNDFYVKRQKVYILLAGIFASTWNFALAGCGFSTDFKIADIWLSVVIFSFDGYVVMIGFFIIEALKVTDVFKYLVLGSCSILSFFDFILFGTVNRHEFFIIDGRTAYFIKNAAAAYYHYAFICVIFLFCATYIFVKALLSPQKRLKELVLKAISYQTALLLLAIPDTLLPFFDIPSTPTSGLGATIAFILTVRKCLQFNAFSVSKINVAKYTFDIPKIATIVFDENWKLCFCNDFANNFLKLKKNKGLDVHEILKIDDETLKNIENGETPKKHFESVVDSISYAITPAVARDKYGEAYCYILMLSDMTYEEELLKTEKAKEKRNQIEKFTLQTVGTLAKTIDARDSYTNGHSFRVAEFSEKIAQKLNLPKEKCEEIRNAALLHDIGKIGIIDNILKKSDKLSFDEYSEIKQHTLIGANILEELNAIPAAKIVAKYHHERFDGKGYPEGLKDYEIPLEARIVCVADSYDAMKSKRCYKEAFDDEIISEEFKKGRNTQFDPEILDAFLQILKEQ